MEGTRQPHTRVALPAGVEPPLEVFVNGVLQSEGADYAVRGGELRFTRSLAREGRLGFWRWFWGAWGIGTYRKDDKVDVAWELDGRPHRSRHAIASRRRVITNREGR